MLLLSSFFSSALTADEDLVDVGTKSVDISAPCLHYVGNKVF
jgi:hypothetical protein